MRPHHPEKDPWRALYGALYALPVRDYGSRVDPLMRLHFGIALFVIRQFEVVYKSARQLVIDTALTVLAMVIAQRVLLRGTVRPRTSLEREDVVVGLASG